MSIESINQDKSAAELMAASLSYFQAEPGISDAALQQAARASDFRLDQDDLDDLGVQYPKAAMAADRYYTPLGHYRPGHDNDVILDRAIRRELRRERQVFSVEDAVAWGNTNSGRRYLEAYRTEIAQGVTAPRPSLSPAHTVVGTKRHEMVMLGAHSVQLGDVDIAATVGEHGELTLALPNEPSVTGHLAWQGKQLVFALDDGRRIAFIRRDSGKKIRWESTNPQYPLTIALRQKSPTTMQQIGRLLRPSTINWILNNNRGSVAPGIYRSRMPDFHALGLAADDSVKTVVSLNGAAGDRIETPDGKRKFGEAVRALGMSHENFELSGSKIPTDEDLTRIFSILTDPSRKPVLLHCTGGSDRTGLIAALYQMEYLGWTKEAVKEEMRKHLWRNDGGPERFGAYVDTYERGTITRMLEAAEP